MIQSSFLLLLLAICAPAATGAIKYRVTKRADNSDSNKLTDSQTDFALRLLQKVGSDGQSVFFSPFSISAAMAMATVGAGGNTKAQMMDKIFPGLTEAQLLAKYKKILAEVKEPKTAYNLSLANRIYVENTYPLENSYKTLISDNFNGDFASVDFINQAKMVKNQINNFVANATRDKIRNLLDSLDSSTRVILINAIYFSGQWVSQFKESNSKKEDFHNSGNKKSEVTMMKQTGSYRYTDDDQMQMISMPYKSEIVDGQRLGLSMLVMLPKQRFGLQTTVEQFSAAKLRQLRGQMAWRQVRVSMPKFRIEETFELAETLEQMGVVDAFDQAKADFSPMVGADKKISISRVVHKAYVSVDEQGSEAAAATAVVATFKSARPGPPETEIEFIADQPFLFAITYNQDVLFMGRFAGTQ